MNTKICVTCKIEKPLTVTNFGKHKGMKDGYRSECKKCRNQKIVKHWSVDGTMLKCSLCKKYKDPSKFDRNPKAAHRGYRHTRCKECKHLSARNKRTVRSRTDQFHRIFVERYQGMRDRAKTYGIPMELTVEDLKDLFSIQKGKCAISGISMTTVLGKGRVPTNVSVDQINPRKGYVKDNVQLVCSIVNTMKADLTMEEMYMFCEAIVNNNT